MKLLCTNIQENKKWVEKIKYEIVTSSLLSKKN